MSTRVKTALVLGPILLAVLVFGGPVLFALLVGAVAVVGVSEYDRMVRPGASPLEAAFVAGWAAVVVFAFLADAAVLPGAALALGALVYFAGWIGGPGPTEATLERWGSVIGGWVFVAYFLGYAVSVRAHGVAPVLFLLAVVWAGDTAAFYVGSAFGRRPLAPAVSPKKSVEGAVASLAAGAAAAAAFGALLPVPHALGTSLLLGAALNVAAQLGDLAESLLKRCSGVKDSGALFPGHGGVLDRIDGFLLTLPLYAAVLGALPGG